MTWGLLLPYMGSSRLLPFSLQPFPGLELAMGALCLLIGLAAVLVSLRWNRKYYLWAGASLLILGLLRMVPGNPLWVALGVLLGMIALLYHWDTLLDKMRPSNPR